MIGNELRKMMAVALGLGVLGVPSHVFAKKAKKADAPKVAVKKIDKKVVDAEKKVEKDIENKLLKLTSLEDAFLKATRNRNLLARYIVQENAKLKEATDDATKQSIRKNIGTARKKLQTQSIAMDVIFGIGKRREYQYDSVKSTVELRVGTVEEAVARAVRTRDALSKFVVEQKALATAEKDTAKKAEIDKTVAGATRQYQVVAAALQVIYGVTPKRNYEYNPKNSTLYLKISETQLDKLKAELAKLQEERAAKADAAKKAAPKKTKK